MTNSNCTTKLCSAPDCQSPRHAKGYCNKHYLRLTRKGNLGDPLHPTPDERFMRYVKIDPATCAWMWVGGKSDSGYGVFWLDGNSVSAHRYAYQMKYGPIPEGMFVCHKHEHLGRHNVNPDHLFLGDHSANMADCAAKGRTLIGSTNHQSVLSNSDVLAIAQSSDKNAILAARYGVSGTIISKIKRGVLWQRVTGIAPTTKHNIANKSGYIGVRFKKGGWEAAIGWRQNDAYKSKYLGRFSNAEEAAKAYDDAAMEIHGEGARLNFPVVT